MRLSHANTLIAMHSHQFLIIAPAFGPGASSRGPQIEATKPGFLIFGFRAYSSVRVCLGCKGRRNYARYQLVSATYSRFPPRECKRCRNAANVKLYRFTTLLWAAHAENSKRHFLVCILIFVISLFRISLCGT